MKTESQNYKVVSVVTVLLIFAALVFLTLAGLSHAFSIAGDAGNSPDEGYVVGVDHTGADQ